MIRRASRACFGGRVVRADSGYLSSVPASGSLHHRHDPLERSPVRLSGAAAGLLLVAVPGILIVLAVAARWTPLMRWDTDVVEAAHRAALASGWLRASAAAVTHLGDTVTRALITVIGVGLLLRRRSFRSAAFLGTVVPLGALVVTLTKLAVGRARPALPEPIAHAGGASFPSGHAMGSTVLYGALLLIVLPFLSPRLRWLGCSLTAAVVVAVGVSRVVLGVHYPSDVLGGWLFGLAWLCLATLLFNRWRVEVGEPALPDPSLPGVEPEDSGRT